MTNTQLYRISGLVLAMGSIAFVLHVVLRSVIAAGGDPASYAQQGPWLAVNALGLAGAVLIAVAWLFFGWFLSLYALLLLPWLADKAPELIATAAPLPTGFLVAFIAGLVAWLAGTVLLAIPFLRGHV